MSLSFYCVLKIIIMHERDGRGSYGREDTTVLLVVSTPSLRLKTQTYFENEQVTKENPCQTWGRGGGEAPPTNDAG